MHRGLKPKPDFRLSPRPQNARNHCSSSLRSHRTFEITARTHFNATERSKSLLELTSKPQNLRNHCSNSLQCHRTLEITARAHFEATEPSKSLLELTSMPQNARNHCSSILYFSFKVAVLLRTVLSTTSHAP